MIPSSGIFEQSARRSLLPHIVIQKPRLRMNAIDHGRAEPEDKLTTSSQLPKYSPQNSYK